MSEVLSIQAGGQIFRELHGYQKGRKGLKSSWKSASQATVGAVQGLEQFVKTMSAAPALAGAEMAIFTAQHQRARLTTVQLVMRIFVLLVQTQSI
ncbi:hypothetical protein FOXYS1_16058 [Fusarium oxysporum]|uniref:Uncharacterized protein n=1 Tax=Fusarium oxysporum TaxID=5507 RepID=A0A8H5DLM3_FUSOX|nr:hypothetical protein FOXYS1_16058 [Fusarium oxysporum]